jgi:hypothetical protein
MGGTCKGEIQLPAAPARNLQRTLHSIVRQPLQAVFPRRRRHLAPVVTFLHPRSPRTYPWRLPRLCMLDNLQVAHDVL